MNVVRQLSVDVAWIAANGAALTFIGPLLLPECVKFEAGAPLVELMPGPGVRLVADTYIVARESDH